MTYRPFTLEGNFIAMQAVHEMLLQSWSPTPGKRDTGIIRLFPATAWRWHDRDEDHRQMPGQFPAGHARQVKGEVRQIQGAADSAPPMPMMCQ